VREPRSTKLDLCIRGGDSNLAQPSASDMVVSIKWHGALTLLIAAVSTYQSTACMDSVSTISIDSASGAFASRRSLDLFLI